MQALAYWVISDHFEELGRPPALFHNGFGLLTVGNLRKPRYWAAHLAAHQGDTVLGAELAGDGADVLVRAWPTLHDDGTVDVLVWNGTNNGELMDGDPRLDRTVQITVDGLGRQRVPGQPGAHRRAPLEHPRRLPDRLSPGPTPNCGNRCTTATASTSTTCTRSAPVRTAPRSRWQCPCPE